MLNGILPILTIIFVILKVTGVVVWSWWTVFSPMLVGLVLLGIAVLILIYALTKIKKESGASWQQVINMYFQTTKK